MSENETKHRPTRLSLSKVAPMDTPGSGLEMVSRVTSCDTVSSSDSDGEGSGVNAAEEDRRSSMKSHHNIRRELEKKYVRSHSVKPMGSHAPAVRRLPWRERVWRLFDDPSSSQWAKVIAITVMVGIGVSTVSFVAETLPAFHSANDSSTPAFFTVVEAICIALFTAEFLIRFVTCPNKLRFMRSFLNFVDMMSILPFYVQLVIGSNSASSATFRVIRLIRVFRVFKISRYVSWIKTFVNAMVLSAWPLGMLLFVMAIGCVVFSSLIYYAERGDWNPERGLYMRANNVTSPFQSIPESFYWCIITMCTVGYGDVVPITAWGRFIAAITCIMGIMVLAVPITVISTNFSMEFNKLKKSKETMRARMMLLKSLNSSKRSGLEAMQDEIDDLTKRNGEELRNSCESVFDSFREDLGEELKEVARIAYRQRKLLPFLRVALPASSDSRQLDVTPNNDHSGVGTLATQHTTTAESLVAPLGDDDGPLSDLTVT